MRCFSSPSTYKLPCAPKPGETGIGDFLVFGGGKFKNQFGFSPKTEMR
ncbi:hypothetical protein C943_01305 [Mariniradius saccharolyticus AK6]|uniref:Uncharacterized protein n=1 Tax=Mariniradius saccharolyticus AK6 TaxID=1239962 RepID=M7XDB3_9BACT|nr:hypothetical protein C943_01305 [Mariniradius saccharolyticus AK6]